MIRLVSRRSVLVSLAAVTGGVLGSELLAAPPKESGLSSEGLLLGRPGFQPRTVMPLPHAELPGFLSRTQLGAHHADYAREVERLKATEQALHEANVARYAELRRTPPSPTPATSKSSSAPSGSAAAPDGRASSRRPSSRTSDSHESWSWSASSSS